MNTSNGPAVERKPSKRRPPDVPRGLKGAPKPMGMMRKSRAVRKVQYLATRLFCQRDYYAVPHPVWSCLQWLLQHPWIRPMLAFNWAAHLIQVHPYVYSAYICR